MCVVAVTCPWPGDPPHGYAAVSQNSYRPGEHVSISCEPYYVLDGQPKLICQDNGEWSAPMPICKWEHYGCRYCTCAILYKNIGLATSNKCCKCLGGVSRRIIISWPKINSPIRIHSHTHVYTYTCEYNIYYVFIYVCECVFVYLFVHV